MFNAYPNIHKGDPPSLDGVRADDGNVYSIGRDGDLYRRRFGVIALWGVWKRATATNEADAFDRAVTSGIESALQQMTLIGFGDAENLAETVDA